MADLNTDFAKYFNFSERVVFFPVRHHSPACAFHLLKTINLYKPEALLIEGPTDANRLIPYISKDTTVPPFCIYSGYHDKKCEISEDGERYRAYYPFLDYSPEYAAIKECARLDIPAYFIDLPYGAFLINSSGGNESSYNEDDKKYGVNEYTAMLTKKSGCRDFNEFWEKEFELSAFSKSTEDFVKSIFALGYFMRLAEGGERELGEGTLEREYFMTRKIKNALEKFNKVLVVTGSFHIMGIGADLEEDRKIPIKPQDEDGASSYLMPYTFEEADRRGGYSAGIPFPAFYQEIWKERDKGSEISYKTALMSFIVKAGKYARETHNITLPDEINALYMATSLAKLRGKKTCGVYELLDGVRSSFIKGQAGVTDTGHVDFMVRLLSGMGVGKVASGDCVPPVVEDFRVLCKKYKIKTSTVVTQEATLDIVKNYQHNCKSRFFHQLKYLDLGFCRLVSGPDYVNRKDKNLAREIWEYRYGIGIETKLIDLSVYGVTVELLCANLLNINIKDSSTAEAVSRDMIHAQVMGINDFIETNRSRVEDIIAKDGNFPSLCSCLKNLSYLANIKMLTETLLSGTSQQADSVEDFINERNRGDNTLIVALAKSAFYFAVYEMENIKNVEEDDEFEIGKYFKNLYVFTKERPEWCDSELFREGIVKIISNTFCNSHIYGVALAIAYKDGIMDIDEFSDRIGRYLESCSSDGGQASSFISGVLVAARDIVFTSDMIINKIDEIITPLSNDDFLAIVPNFRYAFTAFRPSEIDRLATVIADKYGTGVRDLTYSFDVSMDEVKAGMRVDGAAEAQMKKWGFIA